MIFLFRFIFFILLVPSAYAEIYQCNINGVAHFSNTPCDSHILDLELGEDSIDQESYLEELFILPSYPGWINGWEKTREVRLSRFSEIEYQPLRPTKSAQGMVINQQKLTEIPDSMTAKRFAVSVKDIIESICKNSTHLPDHLNISENVFYGHYACSYRRDTKQGEIGYYKILRGESSIYMLAIKWEVNSFIIENDLSVPILNETSNKNKILTAKQYLQNDVKLCLLTNCL